MPAPPSFDFYPANWIHGTRLMSLEAKGAYIDLLAYQYDHGCLPETDELRRRWVGNPPDDTWKRIWAEILPHLTQIDSSELVDADPMEVVRQVWVNVRLHEQREVAYRRWIHRRVVNRENIMGRWGDTNRNTNRNTNGSHGAHTIREGEGEGSSSRDLEVREGGSGGERKETKRPRYPASFEIWWNAFPVLRRKDKPGTFKAWQRAVAEAGETPLLMACRRYAESGEGRSEFVRGPKPWLNQRAWEDDSRSWERTDRSHTDKVIGNFLASQRKPQFPLLEKPDDGQP